jgi:hypothetical protein
VVHQNRDYGRGAKNCLHESMIPEWMDLVVWGNEHECQPNLVESLVGTFRIFQPGSSVACSLVEGESMSCPKHMGMVEVMGAKFRLNPIKFTQIRPFIFSDLNLATIPDLDPKDPKIEDKLKVVLAARVRHLIVEARELCSAVQAGGEGQQYHVEKPEVVLVRLRVDHTGYPTINQQRFGTQFLENIANPSSVLLFARKKREGPAAADVASAVVIADDETIEETMNRVKIEDLVKESLEGNHKQLSVLVESDMASAIDNFVMKKHLSAITDAVQETLEKTQAELFKDITATGKDKIAEQAAKIRKKSEELIQKNMRTKAKQSAIKELSILNPQLHGGSDDDGKDAKGDEDGSVSSAGSGGNAKRPARGGGKAAGRGRGSAAGRATGSGRGAGRGRGGNKKASRQLDDDSDENDGAHSMEDVSDEDANTDVKSKRGKGANTSGRGSSAQANISTAPGRGRKATAPAVAAAPAPARTSGRSTRGVIKPSSPSSSDVSFAEDEEDAVSSDSAYSDDDSSDGRKRSAKSSKNAAPKRGQVSAQSAAPVKRGRLNESLTSQEIRGADTTGNVSKKLKTDNGNFGSGKDNSSKRGQVKLTENW